MFEPIFIVAGLFVAGTWGYILLKFAGNNRRILNDDFLFASEKQRKEAKSSLRMIHLMAPVWIIVVVAGILFLVNSYHPFIRLSILGVALITGGLFFTYLGWAIGMIFRGVEDYQKNKDAQFFSKAFMISFMGAGLLITAIGVLVCISPLAGFF